MAAPWANLPVHAYHSTVIPTTPVNGNRGPSVDPSTLHPDEQRLQQAAHVVDGDERLPGILQAVSPGCRDRLQYPDRTRRTSSTLPTGSWIEPDSRLGSKESCDRGEMAAVKRLGVMSEFIQIIVTLQPATVAEPGSGGSCPDSREVRTASRTAETGLWPRCLSVRKTLISTAWVSAPVLAAVGVAVLPHDHRRAEDPLRVVVVERDLGMVQEREQLGLVPPQPLHQPPRVPLLPRLRQQLVEPLPQPPSPRREPLRAATPAAACSAGSSRGSAAAVAWRTRASRPPGGGSAGSASGRAAGAAGTSASAPRRPRCRPPRSRSPAPRRTPS